MRIPVLALAVALCFSMLVSAQQPPPAGRQPGLQWNEQELLAAARHVRAGRRLTPKTVWSRSRRRKV